jgi:hypothetical protein
MRQSHSIAALIVIACLATGCGQGRKGSAGFHIPDGDPVAGQAVFVSLKCNACHRVEGVDIPAPVAEPPVPVVLGGKVPRPRTDGELVAAIVDPSHKLASGYPREAIKAGDRSRMGEFSDTMTVRDLINVVAFVQSHYEVVTPPPAVK